MWMPTPISILICVLSWHHGVIGQSMWDVLPGSGADHVTTHGHHSAPVSGHGFWGQIMKHEAETNSVPSQQHSLSSSGKRKRRRKVIPASLRSLHTIATDYNDYEEQYDEEIMSGKGSQVDNILRAQRSVNFVASIF